MTLRVVTPPSGDLLTVEARRLHCGLQGIADWDALLAVYEATAIEQLEGAAQRRLLTVVLDWILPGWPCDGVLRLPVAPVAVGGVASITYVDVNGEATLLDASHYVVSPSGPSVAIRPTLAQPWPLLDPDAAEPVVVRFTAGQASSALNAATTTAAALYVAHLFQHRGAETAPVLAPSKLPLSVEAVFGSERWDHEC